MASKYDVIKLLHQKWLIWRLARRWKSWMFAEIFTFTKAFAEIFKKTFSSCQQSHWNPQEENEEKSTEKHANKGKRATYFVWAVMADYEREHSAKIIHLFIYGNCPQGSQNKISLAGWGRNYRRGSSVPQSKTIRWEVFIMEAVEGLSNWYHSLCCCCVWPLETVLGFHWRRSESK